MININKVTIGQYINYRSLLDELQPRYDELFEGREQVSMLDIFREYPEYVQRIVSYWTGWDNVQGKDVDLVLGVFAAIEQFTHLPEPQPVRSFVLNGVRYAAPNDLQVAEKVLPMGKASFGQVLEALQIDQLIKGDHKAIPFVLASLFTQRGETSGDFDLTERARLLQDLPLTEALNAYFFLKSAADRSSRRIRHYLRRQQAALEREQALNG